MSGHPVRGEAVRTLAVCCEGFSAFVAARGAAPSAVARGNEIVSVDAAASLEGVRVGMRRRDAQAMCPVLDVVPHDPERDTRAFEAVMAALEELSPRWEVGEPGRCSVPSRGPSRLFGGEAATARRVHEAVLVALRVLGDRAGGPPAPRVGVAVADGPRAAAVLAERTILWGPGGDLGATGSGSRPGETAVRVVPAGRTAEALARVPVRCLLQGGASWGPTRDRAHLVDVLERLGLTTMARYARLEPSDVLSRFGRQGLMAHDLARGSDSSLMSLAELPEEFATSTGFDPPASTVEQVAFAARASAVQLQDRLAARGLVCTRVLISVRTSGGGCMERLWRDEGALDPSGVAQRARWQLEGWVRRNAALLGEPDGPGPDPGVVALELSADQVVPHDGDQLGLWGRREETPQRVERGVARLEAMLGVGGVTVPRLSGGRSVGERFHMVPFGTPPSDEAPGPWPGSLPPPSPSLVWAEPARVRLLDREGLQVGVDGRGRLSAGPALCGTGPGELEEVLSWAGPWCVDERWWDPLGHRRRARLQVLLASGAHLVTLEQGEWRLEATYD